jgi:GT2 family glycosyltransferase
MPTQVLHFELRSAPAALPVRADVQRLLVLVTDDDRPLDLLTIDAPQDGILSTDALAQRSRFLQRAQAATAHRHDHHRARPRHPAVSGAPPGVPRVSVIVPTRERPDYLTHCLASLSGVEHAGHEVIVVDNAPVTDATAAVARQFGVRYIVEPRAGLDRARNAGVAAATHDVVAFVDDDVRVSRKWMAEVAAPFADADIAAVTGLVLPIELETTAQEQFEIYSQHWRKLHPRVFSREALRASAAALVGIGANMAFRRSVLRDLGGFDVRLDGGTRTRSGGDTDMFARLLDSGQRIYYNPAAWVWHRHRRTHDEMRRSVFGYSAGTFSVLSKRLWEQRDLGAAITAVRWFLGPVVKTAAANLTRRPAPPWTLVLAEVAGAASGPFRFGYEAWRGRASRERGGHGRR